MTKLDIMNERDGKNTWEIVDGKVQRVEKKEIRVVGPIVRETVKVVVPEEIKEEKPKKDVSKRTHRRKK